MFWFCLFFAVIATLGAGEGIHKYLQRNRRLSARPATCATATLEHDVVLRGRALARQPASSHVGEPCVCSELEAVHVFDNPGGQPSSSAQVFRRWAPEWSLADASGELRVIQAHADLEGLAEQPNNVQLADHLLGHEADAIKGASRTTVRTLDLDADVLVVGRLVLKGTQRTLVATLVSAAPNALTTTSYRLLFEICWMTAVAAASGYGLWHFW